MLGITVTPLYAYWHAKPSPIWYDECMRKAVRAIVVHNQSILLIKRNKFGLVYYTLPGGAIDPGETAEVALLREMKEETGLKLSEPRLVYIEDAGVPYGTQYIFVCEYKDGEVALDPHSVEAQLTAQGKNTYEPLWLPVSKLSTVPFRSTTLRTQLLQDLRDGFGREPRTFSSRAEID